MTDILRLPAELGLPPLPQPLVAPTTDSHTHLAATTEFSGLRVADSLALAALVGVTRVVEIGCDVESSRVASDIAARHPEVVAAVAMHPNDAARLAERSGDAALDAAIADIGRLAELPGVRAIGETGLDYYRTRDELGRATQWRSFLAHIELAVRCDLTLVIHDRDAHEDILAALDLGIRPERIVMHCFSGDAAFALECVARDAYLSFPGVVTYKNASGLREALAVTPPDRLLVETDAPYLTPVPCRGKANAPYLMAHTVRFLADQLGMDEAYLCGLLADNAAAAFGGEWGA